MEFFGNNAEVTGMTDAEVEVHLAKATYMRLMEELKQKREAFRDARERLIKAEKALDEEWDADDTPSTNLAESFGFEPQPSGTFRFDNMSTYVTTWNPPADPELATLAVTNEQGDEIGYLMISKYKDDRDFFIVGALSVEVIDVLQDRGVL